MNIFLQIALIPNNLFNLKGAQGDVGNAGYPGMFTDIF